MGRRRITDLGRGGDKQLEKQAICLGVRSVKTVKDLNKKRTTNRDPGAMGAIQVRLLPGLQGGALQGPGVRLGPSAATEKQAPGYYPGEPAWSTGVPLRERSLEKSR